MKITGDLWKCEITKCGHLWIAYDNKPPEKCAKCKSRKWNASGVDRTFSSQSAPDIPIAGDSSPIARTLVQVSPDDQGDEERTIDKNTDWGA